MSRPQWWTTYDQRGLPWTLRVTEEHLDSGIDTELGVLCHFLALIPGQRLPQVFREPLDRGSELVADCFGAIPIREGEQHHITGVTFHQCADGGLSPSHEEVAFPMTRHCPILNLGGTF